MTTLNLQLDGTTTVAQRAPDRCGTCTRCLDACPTQALIAPRLLDARKCISYWTIEAKNSPPAELRNSFGDHFFGCDICQNVCPWNEKIYQHQLAIEKSPVLLHSAEDSLKEQAVVELKFILNASGKEIERRYHGTPLVRARGFGLKRNAILVAANCRLHALLPDIQSYITDSRLGELARWAIAALKH